HFATTPLKSSGHFSAVCKYCNTRFSHGRPNELEVHLAKECEGESIDNEIRSKYLKIAVQRQLSKEKKTSSKNQSKKQKIKVIKINWETEKYLQTADNLTLGLDGWTNPQADLLFNEIEKILIKIGPKKFIGVNASTIAATHRQINQKCSSIINLRCIVHFVNFISHDILKYKLPA
ncbi:19221_t:CDS:2, partial [Dentiscutata erythropus]